jgi:transcriptional regulator with XRE-family HTH domain
MPTLNEVIERHLAEHNVSARAFAERVGMSYPTLLSLLGKGHVPRKPEHRTALRQALGLDQDSWANILAATGKDGVELPDDGPLTLQQLVTHALHAKEFSEQSFATATGIPYPTILGVTRKGSIPREDTLAKIATALEIDASALDRAVGLSKASRRDTTELPTTDYYTSEQALIQQTDDTRSLAQALAEAVAGSGVSIAGFAHTHGLPYLTLMQLINTGVPPRQKATLETLAKALGMSQDKFAESLDQSSKQPQPADVQRSSERATAPFQRALQDFIADKKLTIKAFAEECDLSVLTATRLVKHGALPSRTTTHEKLRALLGLPEEQYRALLSASAPRPQIRAAASGSVYEHEENRYEPADDHSGAHQGVAVSSNASTINADIADLIERLNPRQKAALHAFLLSLL